MNFVSKAKNFNSFKDYIFQLKKELRKSEEKIKDLYNAPHYSDEAKDKLRLIILTLQIAAFDNEIDANKFSEEEIGELKYSLFDNVPAKSLKVKRMQEPHKRIQPFLDEHKELIESLAVFRAS